MGWFDGFVEALSAGFEQEMSRRAVQFFGGRFEEFGAQEWPERQTSVEATSRTGRVVISIDAGARRAP